MAYLNKKVVCELTLRDKEKINQFLEIVDDFKNENDYCDKVGCSNCPFEWFCNNSIENAEEFTENMNELLSDSY